MTPPIIYNLFPRLIGPTTHWPEHAARAKDLGFNWLYLNPWHLPGYSGSMYAVKQFDRINPLFLPPGTDPVSLEPLRAAVGEISGLGMAPMMDLVVGHTSRDSPLVEQHPGWFVRNAWGEVASPWVVDNASASGVTVWEDLAEVNNAHAYARDSLWAFWAAQVRLGLELGFRGFRCDAAYKVPPELWRLLIAEARQVRPDTRFFAETLGAPLDAVLALRDAGFDYIFNSSKWWNFSEWWALEQHARFRQVGPSIAFPESHDTSRLAEESGGSEAVQRQRYAFAAAFSAGVMMTTGYEFGFRRQVSVLDTVPSDWERRRMDLRGFIKRVNGLKLRHPLLHGEGELSAPWGLEGSVLVLQRRVGDDDGWILVNKRPDVGQEIALAVPEGYRLFRVCRDDAVQEGEPVVHHIALGPAEVAYLLPAL